MPIAPRYVPKGLDPASSHTRLARLLDDTLRGLHAPRILDVGCGPGLLRRCAADLGLAPGAVWTGLDADAEALGLARLAGMETVAADLASDTLPPLGGPFDAVVLGDVLEHLPDPDRALRLLLPLACSPGTPVLVSLPNVANLAVRAGLLLGRFEYGGRGICDRTHLRFFTRRSAQRLLADAGLRVLRTFATPVPLWLLVSPDGRPRAPRAAFALQASLHALTRLAPTLLGYQFVFDTRYEP